MRQSLLTSLMAGKMTTWVGRSAHKREILTDVHLEAEFSGIGLLVMQAMMELEIARIADKKDKRRRGREYTRWGSNPGSLHLPLFLLYFTSSIVS